MTNIASDAQAIAYHPLTNAQPAQVVEESKMNSHPSKTPSA